MCVDQDDSSVSSIAPIGLSDVYALCRNSLQFQLISRSTVLFQNDYSIETYRSPITHRPTLNFGHIQTRGRAMLPQKGSMGFDVLRDAVSELITEHANTVLWGSIIIAKYSQR